MEYPPSRQSDANQARVAQLETHDPMFAVRTASANFWTEGYLLTEADSRDKVNCLLVLGFFREVNGI